MFTALKKRNCLLILLFLFAMLLAKAQNPGDGAQYIIYNAQIVDVFTGKIKKEKAVLVENQKIKILGDIKSLSKSAPKAIQIDAHNKFLIPGIWDMHIHLEGQNLVEDNKALLPLFFAYGITTVRDCASDLGEQVLAWRNEVNAGKLLGPTIFTAGLKLEGINSMWKGDLEISNEQELNQMLDKLDNWKVDFVKITENTLKGPLFLKSIQAAHKRGYLVSGHVPIELTIEEMVDAGFSSVEHSSYLHRLGSDEKQIVADLKAGKITNAEAGKIYQTTFDQEHANKNYAAMGKKGLAVTPTLIGGRQLSYLDENNHQQDSMMVSYLTKAYTENYQWRIGRMANDTPEQKAERKKRYEFGASQVTYMQKAGLTILAGSDAAALNTFVYPGESLIAELGLFQQAGMKPLDILQAATINGARFMRKIDTMGSIDQGKVADLVLLDQNPLVDINAVRKVNAVFTKGRYFDRKALNQILKDVKETKIRLDQERAK